MRAKRTEWRMRGIEPYNKIIVVFPSSVLPSRCYGNPPSPEGKGLIGCVHSCHLGALVEKSPAIGTARYIHAPAHLPARVPRREIPRGRNGTLHTRASPLAGAGSAPKNPPRQKRNRTYTNNPNTCPQGLPAAPAHLPAWVPRRKIPCDRNENNRTRLNQAFARCDSPHYIFRRAIQISEPP